MYVDDCIIRKVKVFLLIFKYFYLLVGYQCTGGQPVDSAVFSYRIKDRKRILCEICHSAGNIDCVFPNKDLLREHINHEHRDKYYFFCYDCGKGFKSHSGFQDHMKIIHSKRGKIHSCELCGKRFASNSHLVTHLKSHSSDRPFSCLECGKSYKHKYCLQSHTCLWSLRNSKEYTICGLSSIDVVNQSWQFIYKTQCFYKTQFTVSLSPSKLLLSIVFSLVHWYVGLGLRDFFRLLCNASL